MTRRLFCLLIALLAMPLLALSQERRTSELLVMSGLHKQLEQIETMMKLGIDEAQSKAVAQGLKTAMGSTDLARVKAAVSTAFGADVLREACREAFTERLSAAEEEQVLAWLSTGLGRHVTTLEEREDYTSGDEVAKRDAAAKRLVSSLPASRVALLERLARASLAGEAAATMIINTTVGTTYGVAAATPPLDTTMVDALRKRMEAQRLQMAAYLHQLAVQQYAYTYRSLLNDELERYVAFAESPYGRRYHEATIHALGHAFARGSMQLGLELGTLEKREERSHS
jgi:hypothetical protein